MNENNPYIESQKNRTNDRKLRLSFPLNPSVNKNDNSKHLNRRHTLVPNRSILKPNMDENHTINLASDTILKERRRVSFAPEVTLHKIDYSRSNEQKKLKKRNSIDENITHSPKLNTSQYLWKFNNNFNIDGTKSQDTEDNSPVLDSQKNFIIDEDSTTQTMEMSIELTQEILKHQKEIKEQSQKEETQNDMDSTNSLKDVFEKAEEEIKFDENYLDNDEKEIDMELTETFNGSKIDPNNTTEVSMDLTETQLQQQKDSNDFFGSHIEAKINVSDDNETMEFTQPIPKASAENDGKGQTEKEETKDQIQNHEEEITSQSEKTNAEQFETSQMELTEPISFSIEKTNEIEPAHKNEKSMKLTQLKNKIESDNGNDEMSLVSEHQLSTVLEVSEPTTSDHDCNTNSLQENNQNISIKASQFIEDGKEIQPINEPNPVNEDEKNEQLADNSINTTSDMETSLIGTEMVPLAEVTGDFTENVEEYDSDNSLADDDHVNISLDQFLYDVNVQFYDNIGPSEHEVIQTLNFTSDMKSSPLSVTSSTTSSFTSPTSTSTSTSFSNSNKRANVIEYIDACTNIPYYHYIIHLINQYQSSIKSISTMVNTFSNDVLESNPTAIREYYQQLDDVKADLCTNYQAIATFTRKQAKCQNMRFVSGLLEQLILSYERANQLLEEELSKSLDWRRGILIERQKMIEKKVLLNDYIKKLDELRDNWKLINIEQIEKVNNNLREYQDNKESLKSQISDASKEVSNKTKALSSKKEKKDRLIKELQELKLKVSGRKVPSQQEISDLRDRLEKLEQTKGVKFMPDSDMTLLILNQLKVVFIKVADNNYRVDLQVQDIKKFEPFVWLVKKFVKKNQEKEKNIPPIMFLKDLITSWRQFITIWKDLSTIHYLYKSDVGDNFLKFNFYSINKSKYHNTISIEGKLDNILELDTPIAVQLKTCSLFNEDVYKTEIINDLKKVFSNGNSIIDRFVIS